MRETSESARSSSPRDTSKTRDALPPPCILVTCRFKPARSRNTRVHPGCLHLKEREGRRECKTSTDRVESCAGGISRPASEDSAPRRRGRLGVCIKEGELFRSGRHDRRASQFGRQALVGICTCRMSSKFSVIFKWIFKMDFLKWIWHDI